MAPFRSYTYRSVIAGACLAISASSAVAAPPATVSVNLIAINDLHGYLEANPRGDAAAGSSAGRRDFGGIATLGAMLNQLRSEDPDLLLVGAGDLIGGSPAASALLADEPVLEALRSMGMVVSAAGNHEFDAGKKEFLRQLHGGCASPRPDKACQFRGAHPGSGFPYIAANLFDTATGKRLLPAYHIQKTKGLKIAFVGAVPREMAKVVSAKAFEGLRVTDEADAINSVIPEIQAQGVNAIIALVHQGGFTPESFDKPECKRLEGAIVDVAKRLAPAVDALVSGHTHAGYQCEVDGLPITQAGKYGHFMTRLTLEVTPDKHKVVKVTAKNMVADPQQYRPDSGLAALVEHARNQTRDKLHESVGRIAVAELNRKRNAAGEAKLGNLIADAQLAATQPFRSQIAMTNLSGLRSDLSQAPDKDLTFEQLFAVQPFNNSLVVQELTGEQIVQVLNEQWNRGSFKPLQLSNGFYYAWDPKQPVGKRVVPESVRLNGKTIDPTTRYRVATNEYLADGGGGLATFKLGHRREHTGIADVDALVGYVRENHQRRLPIGVFDQPRIALAR